MKVPLLLAADGAEWELKIVAAFERSAHGVTVTRRCIDVVDLLAVAAAGHGRVALVAAGLRGLDGEAVDRLRAADVRAVAMLPRGDVAVEDRMHALGIEHVVADDADAGVVASVIVDAAARAVGTDQHAIASTSAARREPFDAAPVGPAATPPRDGSVVAVWGPTGAPGRTTVALGLAHAIARLGVASLVVDADVYGGTVSPMLGMLDDVPGIAAACRAAASARLDAPALAAFAREVAPSLRVLTGIPRAQRWPELRPAGVVAVLAAARELADWTVVDCGFAIESDEEVSFDAAAPRRNGATLTALEYADVVLAVGACDAIGLNRLVHALDDLRDTGITTPVQVVLNQVRAGAVSGDPSAEAAAALQRFAGVTPYAALPYDRQAADACVAGGRLLSEAAASSALRQAIAELARSVTGIEGRVTRRRRLAARG